MSEERMEYMKYAEEMVAVGEEALNRLLDEVGPVECGRLLLKAIGVPEDGMPDSPLVLSMALAVAQPRLEWPKGAESTWRSIVRVMRERGGPEVQSLLDAQVIMFENVKQRIKDEFGFRKHLKAGVEE